LFVPVELWEVDDPSVGVRNAWRIGQKQFLSVSVWFSFFMIWVASLMMVSMSSRTEGMLFIL